MSTKSLIICADGYAQSDGTSQVIRALLARGQINATTCLVMADGWARSAEALRALTREHKEISVGLHLDLSRVNPLGVYMKTPMPLWAMATLLSSSKADEDRLFALFRRQWDEFVTHFGKAPDFIDGHRHVHLLPPARRALFRLIKETGFRGWVRQCRSSGGRPTLKKALLNLLSGPFIRDAILHDIATNPGFAGLRTFSRRGENIETLWQNELSSMRFGGVLVVHPGVRDGDGRKSAFRAQEAHALNSGRIPAMMAKANLRFPFTSVVPWMRTYADPLPRLAVVMPQAHAAE